jgi:hypothetical protein
MRALLGIAVVAVALIGTIACSSGGSSGPIHDAGADSKTDSSGTDTAPLSADCQRLYNCCVGAAAQTPDFCTGLVGQNICSVWLQSYSMAGINCP